MERKILPLVLNFKIENPTHNIYKCGVLNFVFDEQLPNILNKLEFEIDGQKFFINFLRNRSLALCWMFQNKHNMNAVSKENVNLILQLSKDVAEKYSNLRSPYKRLLNPVLSEQAEIYLKMMDKSLSKQERQLLAKELNKQNRILKMIQNIRIFEANHNCTPFLIKKNKSQEQQLWCCFLFFAFLTKEWNFSNKIWEPFHKFFSLFYIKTTIIFYCDIAFKKINIF